MPNIFFRVLPRVVSWIKKNLRPLELLVEFVEANHDDDGPPVRTQIRVFRFRQLFQQALHFFEGSAGRPLSLPVCRRL